MPSGVVHVKAKFTKDSNIDHVSTLDAVRRCPRGEIDILSLAISECLNLRCRQALSTRFWLSVLRLLLDVSTLDAVRRCPPT